MEYAGIRVIMDGIIIVDSINVNQKPLIRQYRHPNPNAAKELLINVPNVLIAVMNTVFFKYVRNIPPDSASSKLLSENGFGIRRGG